MEDIREELVPLVGAVSEVGDIMRLTARLPLETIAASLIDIILCI